jgi:hypothetical protein
MTIMSISGEARSRLGGASAGATNAHQYESAGLSQSSMRSQFKHIVRSEWE